MDYKHCINCGALLSISDDSSSFCTKQCNEEFNLVKHYEKKKVISRVKKLPEEAKELIREIIHNEI